MVAINFALMEVRTLCSSECVHVEAVQQLGKQASRTVGFLPAGGYRDYLSRRGIIVAIADEVVGFVLFATSRERVRIAQLVVGSAARGKGIARRLIERLGHERTHCYCMVLRCREDFKATTLWPNLGFRMIGSQPGRAGMLLCWWKRLGARGLFSGDVPFSPDSAGQPNSGRWLNGCGRVAAAVRRPSVRWKRTRQSDAQLRLWRHDDWECHEQDQQLACQGKDLGSSEVLVS